METPGETDLSAASRHKALGRPCASTAMVVTGLLCGTVLAICSSCLGPPMAVKVPAQTKDISGTDREVDLTFLKSGSTTREQVMQHLSAIDTGTKEPQLFWGRWESSAWFTGPLLAPYTGSRVWGRQNILITFDRANVVQAWKVVKDKDLLAELTRLEAGDPSPFDFSAPVHLNVNLHSQGRESLPTADLTLSATAFAYRGVFETARGNVTGLTSAPEDIPRSDSLVDHSVPDPKHVWVTIHFAKRTKIGKSLTCGADPAGLLALRSYVSHPTTR